MMNSLPTVKPDSSEAKKTAAFAISNGLPKRAAGIWPRMDFDLRGSVRTSLAAKVNDDAEVLIFIIPERTRYGCRRNDRLWPAAQSRLRPVVMAGLLQGAGLGTLDPKFRPEGSAFINLSRLYGSTIGIAVVQVFFYGNTQATHVALAKDLTPYRAGAHVAGSIAKPSLAVLNEMVTRQAAVVAIIGQFKILMIAMLIVSPLAFFLRRPRTIN